MTRPNLNAVAIVPDEHDGAVGSTGFHVLRSGSIVSRWLFYLVQTEAFIDSMSKLVQGALYPAVRPKDIQAFRFPVAPLPEQHRIVAAIEEQFTRLDAAVAALERARTNLKRYRSAVLTAACTGRLVPTEAALARAEGRDYETGEELLARILRERHAHWGARLQGRANGSGKSKHEEPGPQGIIDEANVPEGWAWAQFDQLLVFLRNGISARPDASVGTPILRISALRPMSVNMDDLRFLSGAPENYADYFLDAGDLLFTRYNGNPNLVGVCGVVRSTRGNVVHPDKLIRAKVVPTLVLPEFLEIVLNTGTSRAFLARRVRTTAGQSGVSGGDIRGIPVPLPPLAGQHRIVAEVERRLSVLDDLEAVVTTDLKRAERMRQAILRRAFAGRLVPRDPDDEPAIALLARIKAERVMGEDGGRNRAVSGKRSRKTREGQLALG